MHGLAWAATNLGVPFLAPLIFIKAVRIIIPERHADLRKRLRVTYLVRDGQYALTLLAVSTASLYELLEGDHMTGDGKAWLVALGLLSAVSVMLIVAGLLLEPDDPEKAVPAGSGVLNLANIRKWGKTYRIGAASLMLILPVSYAAFQVHESKQLATQQGTQNADHQGSAASQSKGP